MAITENKYTGNGSTVLYSFTFPYLEVADIKVSLDGTLTTAYTLANATTVQFNTAPANGVAIRLFRQTNDDALNAQFFPGSAIRSTDLNNNFTQNLYVTQESNRDATQGITTADAATATANTALSNSSAAVSTANTASSNASAAVSTANTASSNASAAVSTANTASSNATAAVNTANAATATANSAASDAATAISTANSAVSTANTASTAATNAVNTANSASSAASSAVSTANTASSNASAAVSTANTASSNATSAVNTANSALSTANAAASAVANAILYDIVANVAAIPASPANNDAVEVIDSTGIESFTPLTSIPGGFAGNSGLSVRIVYTTTGNTWTWIQYFPNDPETRYLKEAVTTSDTAPVSPSDGDLWYDSVGGRTYVYYDDGDTSQWVDTSPQGSGVSDAISEGDTSAEVIDTGSDGRFVVTTEGSERLRIDSSGNVGVGTTTVNNGVLHVKSNGISSQSGLAVEASANDSFLSITNDGSAHRLEASYNSTGSYQPISFVINGEKARIDTSGRLLVGTSSAYGEYVGSSASYYGMLQVARNAWDGTANFSNWTSNAALDGYGGTQIFISRCKSGIVGTHTGGALSNGNPIGRLIFNTSDGTNFRSSAYITAEVDGVVSTADVPGRLVFSTTSDGASAPTERLRIDSSGRLGIGTTSAITTQGGLDVSSGGISLVIGADSNAQTRTNSAIKAARLATPHYTNAEEPFGLLFGISDSSTNELYIGGGTTAVNAATDIRFHTAANNTTTSGSERARIDSSGRLLIGTSSADTSRFGTSTYTPQFQVKGAWTNGTASITCTNDYPVLWLNGTAGTAAGNGVGVISFNGYDGTNYTQAALIRAELDGNASADDMPGRLVFSTTADGASSPTERMRIASNGFFRASNLGSYNDPVNGNYHEFRSSVNSTIILRVEHTSNVSGNGTFSSVLGSNCNNTSSYHFTAHTNGNVFIVYGNGNIVNTNNSYGSLSDIKLKENIVDANSQWDDLKALQVRNYNFKEGQTHTQIGLVAQEVELVSPGLVSESPDRDEDGNDLGTVTKSVNYSVLYMKAVKALQEAIARIETLEAANTDLAARLTALEGGTN
jgi:hypothetical protein